MRTIAVANQKGGCGKTTVAINLSASLAREGRRTLLLDLDPQAHCALGMAVPEEQVDLSVLDCLMGQLDGEPVELSRITWQIAPCLDVAPSKSNLAGLEPKLGTRDEGDTLLAKLLAANTGRYDYCVIDCPPHLGLLMRNGLRAADEIIIPVDTGYFSLYGLTQQLATIEQLGNRNESKPTVRVLPNQYDVRTKLAREILAELRRRFGSVVYETIVNFNTKLKEGASFGQPITEFAPNSMGARDFQKLAREVMAGEPEQAPTAELLKHVEKLSADAERLLATTTVLVGGQGSEPTAQSTTGASLPDTEASTVPVVEPAVRAAAGTVECETANRSATASPAASDPVVDGESRKVATPQKKIMIPAAANKTRQRAGRGNGQDVQRVAPVSAEIVQDATPASPQSEIARDAEIDRKIEAIYGVRQDGDVVVFRSRRCQASEVQLAGDFNDWMPHTTPMRRLTNGDFEARLRLPKGRYRYRLVVDGRWSHDRENPSIETNEYGELNSIVEVTQ